MKNGQTQLLDREDEPPDPDGVSELLRHNLSLTGNDKLIAGANIAQNSVSTAGILSNLYLFVFYTDIAQGGMGIAIGSTAAVASLAAISIGTLVIAGFLSYSAYHSYMKTANELIKNIEEAEKQRQLERNDLFVELLKLRCLYKDDEA